MIGTPKESHRLLALTLVLKDAQQRAKNKNSSNKKMASSISSTDFIEGGLSAGVFVGADTLFRDQGLFDTSQALRNGLQQGALTIAAPVVRSGIAGAGISLPLSIDIVDPMLVGAGYGLVDMARGRPVNYGDILLSVGSAFLARKGKDAWSYGSLESQGSLGSSVMG